MRLKDFLVAFLGRLQEADIPYCILRNHDGLPDHNPGRDIDVLVRPDDIARILAALRDMPEIVITGALRRSYVMSLYLHGVAWGDGLRAIEIDLVTELAWKGLPYLDAGGVLARRRRPNGRAAIIRVPAAADEAVISLFSTYLIAGAIKARYWDMVRTALDAHGAEASEALAFSLGPGLASDVVRAVTDDERARLLALLPGLRGTLVRRALCRAPVTAMVGVLRHYLTELRIRCTLTHVAIICVLGPDGSGKSSVIAALEPMLRNIAGEVEIRHLKPDIFLKQRGRDRGVSTDPHGLPPRRAMGSTVKILAWLAELWLDAFAVRRRVVTLLIYDRYFHDLIVDPARYRYGGPRWLARAASALSVRPDLLVVLDAPTAVLRKRKREVPARETERQRAAYRREIGERVDAVIVDVDRPIAQVADEVYDAIVTVLYERARHGYGNA